jgi:hypothetical protein
MSRKIRRFILGFLLILAITLPMIEFMLRVVDPLGLSYYEDLYAFYTRAISTPHGYVQPPGPFALQTWSFAANDDGLRSVPDNGDGVDVLFVGDSFTFSWGVDDTHTWINLLARDLGIHTTNGGFPGFNATQALTRLQGFPEAERVVYLFVYNDPYMPLVLDDTSWRRPYTRLSTLFTLFAGRDDLTNVKRDPAYAQTMATLAADERVLILALDNDAGREVARDYGATLIPAYTHRISAADAHADVVGNQEIADGAGPVIARWLGVK